MDYDVVSLFFDVKKISDVEVLFVCTCTIILEDTDSFVCPLSWRSEAKITDSCDYILEFWRAHKLKIKEDRVRGE